MSPLSKIQLHQIFNKLDKNGDGLVCTDELMWLLERIGVRTNRVELERFVGEEALNAVDFLFFYEALTIGGGGSLVREKYDLETRDEVLEMDLRRAFRVFDLNGDGYISGDELRVALSGLGLWDEDCGADCEAMIAAYDSNSDGFLDFHEFKDMMLFDSLASP
ncbi:hypothetical protein ABFS82_03G093900 [Erythranthe guttata]|uniref:EF-hand domain-containing protein n=1 Tax=Erythranthe guttata TaxID=4155 RepID=A0A022QX79_ERYGU|nr:PREDICTED: probable calcium-binding protein CML44 [Erythranthe guttata]EYU32486.1 hypothetical protein MIMGU_mgv1a015295mg [Erythranthe guttata]|eukprot:XP_012843307.1 PREDICTED: probable calcium-binding protein CML44 [Erythranthe guttata]